MTVNEMKIMLKKGLDEMGFCSLEHQIDNYIKYISEIKYWNEKINLTSIEEDEDIIVKHILDSLSITPYIPQQAKTFIDVGTGAGLPGIPIKVYKDEIEITLLDSLAKRVNFLQSTVNVMGLKNIKAIHDRAEDLARDTQHRQSYDISCARAVASLSVLLEYCLPFVKTGGYFIAMKGRNIEEIKDSKNALAQLGGEIEDIKTIHLPFNYGTRNIVLVKKFRQTPTKYPRKSGIPTKLPL